MIEHGVPLDEAVRLAGEASGDRKFRDSAGRFADSIRRGGSAGRRSFPDFGGVPSPALLDADGRSSARGPAPLARPTWPTTYQSKARSRADFLKLAMPSVCLLVLGVGAVLMYALMIFIPLLNLYDELALPVNR